MNEEKNYIQHKEDGPGKRENLKVTVVARELVRYLKRL